MLRGRFSNPRFPLVHPVCLIFSSTLLNALRPHEERLPRKLERDTPYRAWDRQYAFSALCFVCALDARRTLCFHLFDIFPRDVRGGSCNLRRTNKKEAYSQFLMQIEEAMRVSRR